MDIKVASALGESKMIIEFFELYVNIGVERFPDYFTGELLRLDELALQLNDWFERGICAKEIQEAVCKMNWEVFCDEDCLIQGSTDEEERALYDVVKNLGTIAQTKRKPRKTKRICGI